MQWGQLLDFSPQKIPPKRWKFFGGGGGNLGGKTYVRLEGGGNRCNEENF